MEQAINLAGECSTPLSVFHCGTDRCRRYTWQSLQATKQRRWSAWIPSVAWLLPVWTTKSSPDGLTSAQMRHPRNQRLSLRHQRPLPQQLLLSWCSLSPWCAISPHAPQLRQLAAKQEQMAQNIATVQAIDQDIRQKMSSRPPSRAVPSHRANPRGPVRNRRLCSHRQCPPRHLLPNHPCPCADIHIGRVAKVEGLQAALGRSSSAMACGC